MQQQPLPTGWVSLPSADTTLPGKCSTLLSGSNGDSSTPSASYLTTLLGKKYTDLAPAAASTQQPLFHLYYRAQTSQVPGDLCVAFYKTLNTTGAAATSSTVQPNRRWWCITVGVNKTPASGWSYPYVRDLCSYFYYEIVNPAIEALVIAEDHNRVPDSTSFEVDKCAKLLVNDDLILKTVLKTAEPAYYPWTKVKHLKSPGQIDFTQLTF